MRPWSSVFVCACACVVLACGGKVVETAPIQENPSFQPVPVAPVEPVRGEEENKPKPGQPAPTSVTPLDACEVLCERDARCDTTMPALPVRDGESGDCKTRCEERLAGKCGIDDWLLCYAASVDRDSCTPLPEGCRPAFCAWASCSKQPVSNCE
jgi:hypothetical protein